jgi:DinB superfamily
MGRGSVETVLYLMDEAFEGAGGESLLDNLKSVNADDWLWVPPGGRRTIRAMVQHVASCKMMYEDYAFGEGTLFWDQPVVLGRGRLDSVESGVAWLRETQASLRARVAMLADLDLEVLRRANWGELKETRWLLSVLIQHDAYHAGEINHLRALRRNTDAWAYPPPAE